MPTCPTCDQVYAAGQRFCPDDGAILHATEEVRTVRDSDDLIGRVLDKKYRLDEKVGVGGMGAVYRARHVLMDRRVALKVVRPEVLTENNSVKRFHREAKHSCRLDHPNCVRVTDFGSDDGLLYLVMEYLDGKTVGEEVYYDGPLAPPRIAHIGAQVARALHHAHGLGIIHRDLKPDNIMLLRKDDDPDSVKVLDFGLAKLLEREDSELGVTNPSLGSLTEAGIVFGTPEYMSPEQASGNPLDPRTDLYSLGVVMYQMATGELPFKGDTFMAILTKHVTEEPISPSARRPDLGIPLELDRVILHCMQKDPSHRPADAKALAETLEGLAGTLPTKSARVPQVVAAAATIDLTAQMQESGAETVKLDGAVPMPVPSIEVTDPVTVAAALHPRRRGRGPWIAGAAIAAIAAVGAIALAIALTRGGDDEAASPSPHPTTNPPPVVIDAAPAIAPAPDAAPAAAPPDAAPPRHVDTPAKPRDPALARHLAAAEQARSAHRWLKVIAEADQALKIDPRHRRAAFLMGEAQLESGDKANGCKYLRKAGPRWGAARLRKSAGCDD